MSNRTKRDRTKEGHIRLALGEYGDPGGVVARLRGQILFLDAVAEQTEALNALAGKPFEQVCQLYGGPEAVATALADWAKRWGLADHWCRNTAYATLMTWCVYGLPPVGQRRWVHVTTSWQGLLDAEERSLGEWEPTAMTKQQALKAAADRIDAIDIAARSRGASPVPGTHAPDHYVWLALYQVGGHSRVAIAEMVGRQRQTVRDAIRALAHDIGLTLRA